MTVEKLPAEVEGFLLDCIDSVEQLHVLLLLFDNPERDWSIRALNQELRSTEASVTKRLEALIRNKVLMGPPPANADAPYRYAPSSPETGSRISATARCYRQYQYRVIDLIFSKPKYRARSFADAFRFSKEEEE